MQKLMKWLECTTNMCACTRPCTRGPMVQDPYGQVNPLYTPPVVDKMSVQPQKVSFTTPDGTRQTFMATTVM